MIGHLGRQAEWLTEVILLGRGMTQNVGGSRVTAALTDDEKSAIASVLTVRELTSSSAVAAHLALADLLQSYGRTAAAQRGLEYPEHLERAVLGGVRAELDRLGLSWPERRST